MNSFSLISEYSPFALVGEIWEDTISMLLVDVIMVAEASFVDSPPAECSDTSKTALSITLPACL
jgi:hypothetical protein